VLIVDDHPVTREGLRTLISGEPDLAVCGEASTAREAIEMIVALRPRLIIADLSLPDMEGIEFIKDMKARCGDALILVFSMLDEAVYAQRALHAGARGYVPKGRPMSAILRAVRRVLAGHIHLSDEVADAFLHRAVGAPDLRAASPIESLSDRELEILTLIGQGLGPSEIAVRLHLSPRTVETHRANIRLKLDAPDAAALRRYAIEWLRTSGPGVPTTPPPPHPPSV
jgi:DNA-binding NarL/FixJ family response regulator